MTGIFLTLHTHHIHGECVLGYQNISRKFCSCMDNNRKFWKYFMVLSLNQRLNFGSEHYANLKTLYILCETLELLTNSMDSSRICVYSIWRAKTWRQYYFYLNSHSLCHLKLFVDYFHLLGVLISYPLKNLLVREPCPYFLFSLFKLWKYFWKH